MKYKTNPHRTIVKVRKVVMLIGLIPPLVLPFVSEVHFSDGLEGERLIISIPLNASAKVDVPLMARGHDGE